MRACQSNRIDCARLLLRVGADPNQAKADTETALTFATYGGHVGVARMLLEAGAAPDGALHHAGKIDVVGAGTPTMAAAQNGRMPMLQLLAAFGADVHSNSKVRAKAKSFYRAAVLSWLDACV